MLLLFLSLPRKWEFVCWTEERKREKKNSLKSRFSFYTRIPDSLCEKKRRRTERGKKCQSYDSEFTGRERRKSNGYMDICVSSSIAMPLWAVYLIIITFSHVIWLSKEKQRYVICVNSVILFVSWELTLIKSYQYYLKNINQ